MVCSRINQPIISHGTIILLKSDPEIRFDSENLTWKIERITYAYNYMYINYVYSKVISVIIYFTGFSNYIISKQFIFEMTIIFYKVFREINFAIIIIFWLTFIVQYAFQKLYVYYFLK